MHGSAVHRDPCNELSLRVPVYLEARSNLTRSTYVRTRRPEFPATLRAQPGHAAVNYAGRLAGSGRGGVAGGSERFGQPGVSSTLRLYGMSAMRVGDDREVPLGAPISVLPGSDENSKLDDVKYLLTLWTKEIDANDTGLGYAPARWVFRQARRVVQDLPEDHPA